MRKKINFLGLLFVLGVITYFSLKPASGTGGGSSIFLPLHLIAYTVLSGALLVNLHHRKNSHLEAVLGAFMFGLLMELVQLNLSTRYFTWNDIGMNLAGSSLVLLDARHELVTDAVKLQDFLLETAVEKTGL